MSIRRRLLDYASNAVTPIADGFNRVDKKALPSHGAVDVIVVKQSNGQFFSTTTVLQLGRLQSSVGTVKIIIGGREVHTEVPLEIDEFGKAIFQRSHTDRDLYATRLKSSEWSNANLTPGQNQGIFKLQNNIEVEFNVFLFHQDDRLIVSDIDGTITNSDLLGHGAGAIGVSYNHDGVVNLFNAIKTNGYQIVYLSARPVALASSTRRYLRTSGLPDGPVLVSDKGAMTAVFTELGGKVGFSGLTNLKMKIIRSITEQFDVQANVVHGAYGNRETDYQAYSSAGISLDKIWIINKQSVLQHIQSGKKFLDGYVHQLQRLDDFFPRLSKY